MAIRFSSDGNASISKMILSRFHYFMDILRPQLSQPRYNADASTWLSDESGCCFHLSTSWICQSFCSWFPYARSEHHTYPCTTAHVRPVHAIAQAVQHLLFSPPASTLHWYGFIFCDIPGSSWTPHPTLLHRVLGTFTGRGFQARACLASHYDCLLGSSEMNIFFTVLWSRWICRISLFLGKTCQARPVASCVRIFREFPCQRCRKSWVFRRGS